MPDARTLCSPEVVVADMTLSEKIGQMTQASNDSIEPREVADHFIGSVLSGGNGNPSPNSPEAWRDMVGEFLDASLDTRLGIPAIYGIDAVHGHSNVRGATIFPHNIGLGSIGDEQLVRRIGQVTATEMLATGVQWTFAPTVAVAQDIRWGRTYESYGCDAALVARLGAALVAGLATPDHGAGRVLACAKHFAGDGAAEWGTVDRKPWMQWWDGWGDSWNIDQGDTRISEDLLRDVHLRPYARAIDAGVMSVMASYSSWNGVKMHAHADLLTTTLKGELGFEGFVVSDWMGVDQIAGSYEESVIAAVNAGIDMVMVPLEWQRFIDVMRDAVARGRIPMARIDDAVRRILRSKSWLTSGNASAEMPPLGVVGSHEHRKMAAEAARRSVVLLKDDGMLPLDRASRVLVAGRAADDIGLQCGGWTVGWQGSAGPVTPGTTLLEALKQQFPGNVTFSASGEPDHGESWDVGIVCVAEEPYAEGPGDHAVPSVPDEDHAVFEQVRARCKSVVLIVYSGRPVIIPDMIRRSDAVIAAWLPGSEATELPDLLVGSSPFEGRLTQPWPASIGDLDPGSTTNQFPVGHGLRVPDMETRP